MRIVSDLLFDSAEFQNIRIFYWRHQQTSGIFTTQMIPAPGLGNRCVRMRNEFTQLKMSTSGTPGSGAPKCILEGSQCNTLNYVCSRVIMMTPSNGNIFHVPGPLCGEFTNSPHKRQWRGVLMFSFICAWINGWVKNREAVDLRRHRTHYDVIVMSSRVWIWAHFLSLARSKLRLYSANHRPGYWSNLPCDWPSTAWA